MKENISSKDLKKLFSFTFDYVNFGRFDAGGVLHHANYYHIHEELRERYLISKSLSYKKLMDQGYHLPLVSSQQHFLKPVLYDQRIRGQLSTLELKNSSVSLHHELFNEDNETLHVTISTHVLVKMTAQGFKPCRIMEELQAIF